MSDNEHAILNLSPDEKRAFAFLFAQADKDQLGVVTGENAVSFFERTKLSPDVLGEIWQVADTENRGFLSKPGFCMVLRLIGHYQAGREPTNELAFKPAPVPRFEGLQIPTAGGSVGSGGSAIPSPTAAAFPPTALQPQLSGQPPIRVPPLDPQKVQQYSGLFERSGVQNGALDGATAKAIFERAGLPNEILGRIWMLSDREQKGSLDQTEFIVAMHLLTCMKTRAMAALPNVLPPGLYEAAARRGARPPSRQGTGPTPVPRQLTGSSVPRTQSPLARAPGYGTPPPQSAQLSGTPWLITPADKVKFDQFFNTVDTQRRGVVTGEQAVTFFSDSHLPEDTLAQIWDLADINSEGQLNKDEFAVAMYLIRQQRTANSAPLPAFLPPALVPPSMRKQTQQTQSTAPVFDNANNTSNLPKSAADDLFGLDQITQPQAPVLQPQGTGTSATRDPFSGSTPGSPSSPGRFPLQSQPASSMFKPFMPTSAFGASLAQTNTGGSLGTNQTTRVPSQQTQQQSRPSPADDLLGDNEASVAESSKITTETTELANMSSQIGNLRTQMGQTQSKKDATQADLTATQNQKRDLELRLQQFRTQYEQEVRTVKELEQQLAASKESTKKLSQEFAMIEGTYQDLQSQHRTISQALQADQQENASLKQRIAQLNAEVAKVKPEIEKLKLDARQQKGLVSINKKQLATNESERDRLQDEKLELERESAEREEQARAAAVEPVSSPAPLSNIASPSSTLSATNPFFRKVSNDGTAERSMSPEASSTGPTPSAFDALFGPSAAFTPSRTGTPPATSFVNRSVPPASAAVATANMADSIQSISSAGERTPSATPPSSDHAKDSPQVAEPPPPPASRQFSASHLPVVALSEKAPDSEASSMKVVPPASRAGEVASSRDTSSVADDPPTPLVPGSFTEDPEPEIAAKNQVPGAFPNDFWSPSNDGAEAQTPRPTQHDAPAAKDDFDSAFANFGEADQAKEAGKEHIDPFAQAANGAGAAVHTSEFPPIQSLEPDEESDSDEEDKGFDDDFTTASPPRTEAVRTLSEASQPPMTAATLTNMSKAATSSSDLPVADAQRTPPTYDESDKLSHGGSGERTDENRFPPEFGGLLPSREDPTSPPLPEASSSSATAMTTTEVRSEVAAPAQHAPAKNAFDDFDAFDDLAEAKEADKSSSDLEFGFSGRLPSPEFNPAFDTPPAESRAATIASAQHTPATQSHSIPQTERNGFSDFGTVPSANNPSTFAGESGSIQHTSQNVQHDWDAIFSGLDTSKSVDTSLSNDPWGGEPATDSSSAAPKAATTAAPTLPVPSSRPERGGAITPGTEHDDPILKRLTGMGYPRKDALDALEKYDYDINRAVDHLSG